MAGDLVEVWNNRVPALVVLLSFTMQVTLLVTAEFRRRLDKAWLRAVVWSAYMLADWAAIYALGHLSVAANGRPGQGQGQGQHHLMLLWAPFMLVHLGGQDNITAYALEDNRLWLRHLQALAVQAAAAAYVLYLSWPSSSTGFRQASVILYVVGVLKYGERVAALWLASSSRLGNNYLSLGHLTVGHEVAQYTINGDLWNHVQGEAEAEKKLLVFADLLLDVSKKLILGPLPYSFKLNVAAQIKAIKADELYKVAERQLSMMHDILYTKAPVIDKCRCIRIVSGAGTAAAFVLFHQGLMQVLMRPGYCGRRQYCNRADVAVTYVLLVGAVVLEGMSMATTVCSSRCAKALLRRAMPRHLLSRVVRVFQRRHYWSGTMGQLNLLELCVRSRSSRWSKGARLLRLEEWWNRMVYSGSARVTDPVEDLVMELAAQLNAGLLSSAAATVARFFPQPLKDIPTAQWDAYFECRHSAAAAAAARFFESSVRRGALLEGLGLMDESDDVVQRLSLVGSCDMDETILVWHIATDIYLRAAMDDRPDDPLAEAVQALSNYMVFLLAARPGMLPASANRNRYVEMCYCLTGVKYAPASRQGLAAILRHHGDGAHLPLRAGEGLKAEAMDGNVTLKNGCWLGAKLLHHQHADGGGGRILKMVAQVWAEILCYAGHRCSGNSHAGRLSNGGELVTVAAIVMEYVKTGTYNAFYQGPMTNNTIETHDV